MRSKMLSLRAAFLGILLFGHIRLVAFLILFGDRPQVRRSWLFGGGLAIGLAYVAWLARDYPPFDVQADTGENGF
jgi:hypothetical protein